jgi:hypothetical protein
VRQSYQFLCFSLVLFELVGVSLFFSHISLKCFLLFFALRSTYKVVAAAALHSVSPTKFGFDQGLPSHWRGLYILLLLSI